MNSEVPFLFPYLLFVLLIMYVFISSSVNLKSDKIPPELFLSICAFSSVFVGFILVYAMQRYDIYKNNKATFIEGIDYLKKLYPKNTNELNDYLNNYIAGGIYDSLPLEEKVLSYNISIVQKDRTVALFQTLDSLYITRLQRGDNIPNSIWYVLFFILTMASLLMISDSRIHISVIFLIMTVIWSPCLVVFYLYSRRNY